MKEEGCQGTGPSRWGSHEAGWCRAHPAPRQGSVAWGVGGHKMCLREALHEGSGRELCG